MAKKKESFFETVKTIVVAVLLAMTFRSFFYEPFHIPSGSMKSNLLIGDYIFVDKMSYGYSRYSFPFGFSLFGGRILFDEKQLQRGDVVVFRKPNQPDIDFIKRVIGLPGDTVQVINGNVYLNGRQLPRESAGNFREFDEITRTQINIPRFIEILPDGREYRVLEQTHLGLMDNTVVYQVPEKHYFMMGDNRDNSTDSRYVHDVGFVPEENLVGKAVLIAFSMDEDYKPRLDRFFTLIR